MKKSIFTILSITILILAWQLLTILVRLPDLVPSIPHLFSTFRIRFVLSISHGDSVARNHRDVYIVNGGYGSFSLVLQMRVDL